MAACRPLLTQSGFIPKTRKTPLLRAAQAVDARVDGANSLAPRGITLTGSDIGREVVYRNAPDYEAEEGVIVIFNRD